MADTSHTERLVRLFGSSTIAQSMGIAMHYDAAGHAHFHLPYRAKFDHFLDDVHGGAIATLVDNAGWFAAAAQHSTWIVSVEIQVRYLAPAGREDLTAIGEVLRTGKRITQAQMRVLNRSGALVAVGSGSFAVTSSPLPDPNQRGQG
jgi:uncharacterized protein (TIGR00369 family)